MMGKEGNYGESESAGLQGRVSEFKLGVGESS